SAVVFIHYTTTFRGRTGERAEAASGAGAWQKAHQDQFSQGHQESEAEQRAPGSAEPGGKAEQESEEPGCQPLQSRGESRGKVVPASCCAEGSGEQRRRRSIQSHLPPGIGVKESEHQEA